MRYVNQKDYPDLPYRTRTDTPEDLHGQNSTVATSGCGLCSAIMMIDRLLVDSDYKFDIEDALQLSLDNKANHTFGTDYDIYSEALGNKFNIKHKLTNDINDVAECIRDGGCCVAKVSTRENYKAVFTKGHHYITVVSITTDGRFVILDPSQVPGKYDEAIAEGRVEVQGHLCFCTPEVLEDEAEGMHPTKYYLFWRE